MTDRLFVVIGAQRAGTSHLYELLDQHPEIAMAKPAVPEPKFFLHADEWRNGSAFYIDKYFQRSASTRILGEKSTSYLESPEAASRIARVFPRAQILVSLRHPAERAVSNFFYSARNGLEPRTLRDAILGLKPAPERFGTSVSPYDYLRRGHYAQHLKPYVELFGLEQIRIVSFTGFVEGRSVMSGLYEELGVDPAFEPVDGHAAAMNAADRGWEIDQDVAEFLSAYYRPHIGELERLLGRTVDAWASAPASTS